jgi:hypothetical protein
MSFIRERTHEEHLNVLTFRSDLAACLNPGPVRQSDVHEHDFGTKIGRLQNSILPTADVYALFPFQQTHNSNADDQLIISY